MAEKTKATMRRPSLFVIKELLEEIREAGADKHFSMATFNYLVGSGTKNRHDLGEYLNLLTELQWITQRTERDIVSKRTTYILTEKGIAFLRLFRKKQVTTS